MMYCTIYHTMYNSLYDTLYGTLYDTMYHTMYHVMYHTLQVELYDAEQTTDLSRGGAFPPQQSVTARGSDGVKQSGQTGFGDAILQCTNIPTGLLA